MMDWTNAFASSDTTKLFLDPGQKFWISVRNELTHAEERAIALGSFRRLYREGEQLVELDQRAGADHKVLTYLVDWNVVGKDGKTIDVSSADQKRDAVKNLKPEAYDIIEALIDAHAEEQARKKAAPSGETASSATSEQPVGSASVG